MAGKPEKVTDKSVYLNRRVFMRAAVLAGTATASTLLYRSLNSPTEVRVEGNKVADIVKTPNEEALKQGFSVSDSLTPLEAITNYNNFYEFDTFKGGVASAAKGFVTNPWT